MILAIWIVIHLFQVMFLYFLASDCVELKRFALVPLFLPNLMLILSLIAASKKIGYTKAIEGFTSGLEIEGTKNCYGTIPILAVPLSLVFLSFPILRNFIWSLDHIFNLVLMICVCIGSAYGLGALMLTRSANIVRRNGVRRIRIENQWNILIASAAFIPLFLLYAIATR